MIALMHMTKMPSSTNLPCSVDAPSDCAVSCLSSTVFMRHCSLRSNDTTLQSIRPAVPVWLGPCVHQEVLCHARHTQHMMVTMFQDCKHWVIQALRQPVHGMYKLVTQQLSSETLQSSRVSALTFQFHAWDSSHLFCRFQSTTG